jgi:hypothetical protein
MSITDHQFKQPKSDPDVEDTVKQKGLSKEAWAAISAIAVALISGSIAIITALIPH